MVMIWMDQWSGLVVQMVLLDGTNGLRCNNNKLFVRRANEVASESGDTLKKGRETHVETQY